MFAAFLQVLSFLIANRDDIVKLIDSLQSLFGPGTGPTKAQAFKDTLAAMMGASDTLERAWPLAKPIIDALVAMVKGKAAAQ